MSWSCSLVAQPKIWFVLKRPLQHWDNCCVSLKTCKLSQKSIGQNLCSYCGRRVSQFVFKTSDYFWFWSRSWDHLVCASRQQRIIRNILRQGLVSTNSGYTMHVAPMHISDGQQQSTSDPKQPFYTKRQTAQSGFETYWVSNAVTNVESYGCRWTHLMHIISVNRSRTARQALRAERSSETYPRKAR